jgi:hypothetical protein
MGTLALTWPLAPEAGKPKDLPLREADFYRPHDLAG